MIRYILPVCLVLGACTSIQNTADKAGRDAAKTIIPETLAVYFPQVPKALFQPFTDCIVDNADASQVQSLAADVVVGVDEGTAETVRDVLADPSTQQCLSSKVTDIPSLGAALQ